MRKIKCPSCGSSIYKKLQSGKIIECLNCNTQAQVKDFETKSSDIYPLILYVDEYDSNKKIIEHEKYIEVIGGDGSLLKAINRYKNLKKPFFGFAKGTVNFLMNKSKKIKKNVKYKSFHLIKVKITHKTPNILGNMSEVTETFQAFNDICIGGDMDSWIEFDVSDHDKIIRNFKGGGMIISTAQGSTGINRNNNGVILPLSSKNWAITGDKTNRHINYVLEPQKTKIEVSSRKTVTVWVDGSNNVINNILSVEVSKGDKVTVMFNDYESFKKKRL